MILLNGEVGVLYEVVGVDLPEEHVRYLANLGLKVGSQVELVSRTKSSAIIMLKHSRLAFDQSILEKIDIQLAQEAQDIVPLSTLLPGEFGHVVEIYALNEMKRRLMDMGLTKHTKVYLRKLAPLGDPIEISLRGYELTLRKSEAQQIGVTRVKVEEEA